MIACLASVALAVALVACSVLLLNEHRAAPPSTVRSAFAYALFIAMCLVAGNIVADGIRAWWSA